MRWSSSAAALGAAVLAACSGFVTGSERPTVTVPAMTSTTPAAPSPAPSPSIHGGPRDMPALHPSVDDYPQGRAVIELVDGTTWDIPVLLATNASDRAHGLMEVPQVPAATGMAFVFAEDRTGGFWMKGTETDLDIAWFRADGVVVAMTTMTVCDEDPCPSHRPGAPYRYALEVRAGWFASIGLTAGARITISDSTGRPPRAE